MMESTASSAPSLTYCVVRFGHDVELPLQRACHHQLPFWEGSTIATLQGRTRTTQVTNERNIWGMNCSFKLFYCFTISVAFIELTVIHSYLVSANIHCVWHDDPSGTPQERSAASPVNYVKPSVLLRYKHTLKISLSNPHARLHVKSKKDRKHTGASKSKTSTLLCCRAN